MTDIVPGWTELKVGDGEKEDVPDDFEETEFETVGTFCADAEVWKNEETSVWTTGEWSERLRAWQDMPSFSLLGSLR